MAGGRVGDNNFGVTDWIVNGTGLSQGATHTTIASALTDASSGDTIFIRPGTYTENLTLKAGVTINAFQGDAISSEVIISGTLTASYSGTASLVGLRLQTNSDFVIVCSGANTTNLSLFNCYLDLTNNTGISGTAANGTVTCETCSGDLGTTGIAIFSSSGTSINMRNTYFSNSGGSSTANTISAGSLIYLYASIFNPTSVSGTAIYNGRWSTHSSASQNVTCLTLNSSGSLNAQYCNYASGSAIAITITSGTFQLTSCLVSSTSGTAAISGAGTLNQYGVIFGASAIVTTVTTLTQMNALVGPISFDKGTNYLDFYEEGTWTPTITGSTTPPDTITYSTQNGIYTRIGNIVHANCTVAVATFTLGAGAGQLRVSDLPYTSVATYTPIGSASLSNVNFATAGASITAQIIPSTVQSAFIETVDNTATAAVNLSAVGASTSIRLSVSYFV